MNDEMCEHSNDHPHISSRINRSKIMRIHFASFSYYRIIDNTNSNLFVKNQSIRYDDDIESQDDEKIDLKSVIALKTV
jgi:hypothetical protein